MRFGNRGLDVRDAPAAETREMMVGPSVGVEAVSGPGQFTEQPSVDEQAEVAVDGRQAHPWRSADDHPVDFLGSGVRLDASDHLEHRSAWNGQPESPAPQCALSTLDARWEHIARRPSNSLLRDDSHLHQPRPDPRHGTSGPSFCQEDRADRTMKLGDSALRLGSVKLAPQEAQHVVVQSRLVRVGDPVRRD